MVQPKHSRYQHHSVAFRGVNNPSEGGIRQAEALHINHSPMTQHTEKTLLIVCCAIMPVLVTILLSMVAWITTGMASDIKEIKTAAILVSQKVEVMDDRSKRNEERLKYLEDRQRQKDGIE